MKRWMRTSVQVQLLMKTTIATTTGHSDRITLHFAKWGFLMASLLTPSPQKNQIILNYIPKNLHKQNRSFWYFHGTFGGRNFFSLLGLILTYWIFVLFTYPRYQPLCVNYWRNYKENRAYLSWWERKWIKNNHSEAWPRTQELSNIKPLAGAAQRKKRE